MTIEQIKQLSKLARIACEKMRSNTASEKRQALIAIANAIENNKKAIIIANNKDIKKAKEKNISSALIDRLSLTETRIQGIIEGVLQIANQDDPIGSISNLSVGRRGFKVGKMRTSIGVVGIIYESRPNVTVDAAAICIKSGNACILRGGSEAFYSNSILIKIMQDSLKDSELDSNVVQFVSTTDRKAVSIMLETEGLMDVLIPRGGKGLVKLITDKARVPVIKHLDGICHVYIDEYADKDIAINVAFNSKTYRYGICGAMETLLIHESKIETIIPELIKKYNKAEVELVADNNISNKYNLKLASDSDWHTEYLCPKLSIKSVKNIEEAITHINYFGSHHTDSIITNNLINQNKFLNLVDSSSVMVNTATCFADGYEYGLGAEIGISTDKIHVRGPVGVLGLTTEKFIILGNGEIRS